MTTEPSKELSVSLDEVFEVEDDESSLPALGDVSSDSGDANNEDITNVETASRGTGLRTVVEWVAVVIVSITAALLIKEFAFQAFEIPSASMQPTVVPDDRILVNKLAYNFGDVERGDLVVFDRPPGTPGDTDQLIKRVIGLPGETVEVRSDGGIWITEPGQNLEDATRLDEPYLSPGSSFRLPGPNLRVEDDVWDETCANQTRVPGRCTLSDETYLVLGDNRNFSVDSRSFGPIVEESIVGQAFLRIWPFDSINGL